MAKTAHDLLKQDVMNALNDLFADTSVNRGQTRESLQEITNEIGTMLDAIREDQRKEGGDDDG